MNQNFYLISLSPLTDYHSFGSRVWKNGPKVSMSCRLISSRLAVGPGRVAHIPRLARQHSAKAS